MSAPYLPAFSCCARHPGSDCSLCSRRPRQQSTPPCRVTRVMPSPTPPMPLRWPAQRVQVLRCRLPELISPLPSAAATAQLRACRPSLSLQLDLSKSRLSAAPFAGAAPEVVSQRVLACAVAFGVASGSTDTNAGTVNGGSAGTITLPPPPPASVCLISGAESIQLIADACFRRGRCQELHNTLLQVIHGRLRRLCVMQTLALAAQRLPSQLHRPR